MFAITLSRYPRDRFAVRSFVLNDFGLSSHYHLTVTICHRDVLVVSMCLDSRAIFTADYQQRQFTLPGVVTKVQVLGKYDGECYYHLRLESPLYLLHQRPHSRVFASQGGNMLIRELLHGHSYRPYLHYRCRLQRNYPQEKCFVQYHETDWQFMQRVMSEQGLASCFHQVSKRWLLDISDRGFADDEPLSLVINDVRHGIIPQGIYHAAYEVYSAFQQVELSADNLQAMAQPLRASSQNKTQVPGEGRLQLYGYYRADNHEQLQHYADNLQRQLDCQREILHFSTQHLGVVPGRRVVVEKRCWQVVSVTMEGSQVAQYDSGQAWPEEVQLPLSTELPLQLQVVCIPSEVPYCQPQDVTQREDSRVFPALVREKHGGVSLATVATQGEHDELVLDHRGNYAVVFEFDEAKQVVNGVPKLQVSGGCALDENGDGVQFSLLPGTRVAVSFCHGELSIPVIVGAISESAEALSSVQHRISSAAGNDVLLEDGPESQRLILQQSGQVNQMVLAYQDSASCIEVKTLGDLVFFAKKKIQLTTEQDYQLTTANYYQGCQGQLEWQARQSIVMRAYGDGCCEVLDELNLSVGDTLQMTSGGQWIGQAEQTLSLSSQTGDMVWQVAGKLVGRAGTQWLISSRLGQVHFSQGIAALRIAQESVDFSAPHVMLIAPSILVKNLS